MSWYSNLQDVMGYIFIIGGLILLGKEETFSPIWLFGFIVILMAFNCWKESEIKRIKENLKMD